MGEGTGRGWTLDASTAETARFGVRVARLTVQDGAEPDRTLADELARADADVVVARWGSASGWVPLALAGAGRTVLPASGIVYWSLPSAVADGAVPPSLPAGVEVREVSGSGRDPEVAGALDHVVGDAFADYLTHYSYDPLFPEPSVRAGYQEWARVTASDPDAIAVLLLVEGEPVGMATAQRSGDEVDILLAGVVRSFQGRGLYPHLLERVRSIAERSGVPRVVISTQSSNVRVQSIWSRLGWRPYRTVETAHLVRPGLVPTDRVEAAGAAASLDSTA
jgi:GNAT superfamily N-acetyltransferase